jgi:MFS family permease
MKESTQGEPGSRAALTPTEWLICTISAIGFAFDIYALLMMPLIGGPAIADLLQVPLGSPEVKIWVGRIFWWSAMAGGAFGLIGGYLTDLFGRRRVLVWSILIYSFSALASGFSTSVEMLLVLRCTTFIGVCVEFVAAVAWLAELFPDPKRREAVLGYTQAFSSVGGLMVTGSGYLCTMYASSLPAIYGKHLDWRYTLISGVIPAIPLMVIRPFLPESPAWRQKKEAGTLKRPSIAALFQPAYRRTTIVTALLFACSYGAAFGALQLTPTQIVPGLPGATRAEQDEMGKKLAVVQERLKPLPAGAPERSELEGQAKALEKSILSAKQAGKKVQAWQEMGGLLGRFVLAFLAIRIVSRRTLLRIFQVPGLLIVPLVFYYPARNDLELLKWGIAVAGFLTVAQLSFWGNYLPRVYPVHLRGTGESFAANVGGRMLGTSAAFVTTNLIAPHIDGKTEFEKVAIAAAIVGFSVYALGTILCFFLPEPSSEELPE